MIKPFLIRFWPFFFIVAVWFIFSSPYFLKDLAPFPSDYLVNFFSPWSSYPELAGPVKNNAISDVIVQIYPWKEFTIDTIKNGQIPLWNPYSFSGTPHLANYQSAVLSPFNVLFFITNFIDAWSLLILLQPLLAGMFMYLFISSLKVSKIGSLISAISFMFCGFITVWLAYGTLSYAILFTPLAFFAIEGLYRTRKYKYAILISLTVPLSFLSGHFQISLYFLVSIIFYSLFKLYVVKEVPIFLLNLCSIVAGLLFSAPQLIPSVELYLQAVRSTIFQKGEVIPWSYLPTFLSPDFYGNPVTRNDWLGHYAEWNLYIGVIPFFLACYSVFSKKAFPIVFFVFGIIILMLAFNTPLLDLLIGSHVPVLSTSAASRIISIYCVIFASLSGLGFDQFIKNLTETKNFKTVYIAIFFLFIFFILWLIPVFNFYIPEDKAIIARQNLIFPTLIFCFFLVLILAAKFLKNKKLKQAVLGMILILVAIDLLRFSMKWQPFEPKKFIYPETRVSTELKRIDGPGRVFGSLGQEASMHYLLSSVEGYDPLYIKRYGELTSAAKSGRIGDLDRSAANLDKRGKQTSKVLNILGVSYFVHKVSDTNMSWAFPVWEHTDRDVELMYGDSNYQIFKSKKISPRTFVTNKYEVANKKDEIIDIMLNEAFDPAKEIVLEEDPGVNKEASISATSDMIKYSPNAIEIEYVSSHDGLLFLSDNYYPGWNAYVDGKKTEILRANYTFRAVKIPAGDHFVEFKYQPQSFIYGIFLAGVGILILSSGALLIRTILTKLPKT